MIKLGKFFEKDAKMPAKRLIKKIKIHPKIKPNPLDDLSLRALNKYKNQNTASKGLHSEKLHTQFQEYDPISIKVNNKARLVLVPDPNDKETWMLVANLDEHQYQELDKKPNSWLAQQISKIEETNIEVKLEEEKMEQKEAELPLPVEYPTNIELCNNHFVTLNEEQEDLTIQALPIAVSGAPGSGKSSTLLISLKKKVLENPQLKYLFLAPHSLVPVLQKEWHTIAEFEGINPDSVHFRSPKQIYDENTTEPFQECGVEDFKKYLQALIRTNPNLKIFSKELDEVYQELRTMSAYTSLEEYNAQVHSSLYPCWTIRSLIWKIKEKYLDHLKFNKLVDYSFTPIIPSENYDLCFVDEAQDLSRKQIQSLIAQYFNIFWSIGDHQQIFGSEFTIPFIKAAYYEYYSKDLRYKNYNWDKFQKKLTATYRCPEKVTKLANFILKLKAFVLGAKNARNNIEIPFINSLPDCGVGSVFWYEKSQDLQIFIKDKDNADFAVIASPAYFDKAVKLFGRKRVFTPETIKGQQYFRVLLFHPLEQKKYQALQNILSFFSMEEGAPLSAPFPEIRHSIAFNELFVAVTRTEGALKEGGTLTLFQPEQDNISNLRNPLKAFCSTLQEKSEQHPQAIPTVSTSAQWEMRKQNLALAGLTQYVHAIETDEVKLEVKEVNPVLGVEVQDIASKVSAPPPVLPELKNEVVSFHLPGTILQARKQKHKNKNLPLQEVKLTIEEQQEKLILEGAQKGNKNAIKNLLTHPNVLEIIKKDNNLLVTLVHKFTRNLELALVEIYNSIWKLPILEILNYPFFHLLGYLNKQENNPLNLFPVIQNFNEVIKNSKKIKITAVEKKDSILNKLEPSYPMKGESAVILAASEGSLDQVKILYDRGVRCDAPNFWGHTPLLMAVFKGHTQIISFLLEKNIPLCSFAYTPEEWVYLTKKLQEPLALKMQAFMSTKNLNQKIPLKLHEIAEIFEFQEFKTQLLDAQYVDNVTVKSENLFSIQEILTHPRAIELLRRSDTLTWLLENRKEDLHQVLCKLIKGFSNSIEEEDQNFEQMDSFIGLILNNPEFYVFDVVKIFARGYMEQRINKILEGVKQGNLWAVDSFYKIKNLDQASTENKLFEAIQSGAIAVIRSLAQQGVNLNQIDPKLGLCPIHIAAIHCNYPDNIAVITELLKNNVNIDQTNNCGETVLHCAINQKNKLNKDLVQFLLNNGANPTRPSPAGSPALLAAQEGKLDLLEMLHQKNANCCNQENLDGDTPLLMAVLKGHEDMVRFLLNKGMDIKPATHSKMEWLKMTVTNLEHFRKMRSYLQGQNGKTVTLSPRMLAHILGFEELRDLLLVKENVLGQNNMFASENNAASASTFFSCTC